MLFVVNSNVKGTGELNTYYFNHNIAVPSERRLLTYYLLIGFQTAVAARKLSAMAGLENSF